MAGHSERFVVLDAMRGVAALAILVYHAGGGPMPMGYAAVDLFFLLSGFVLAHAHGAALADGRERRAFVTRRIIRIYPTYLLAACLGMIVTWRMTGQGIDDWNPRRFAEAVVPALLFLPVPNRSWLGVFPFNGPSWSLFFELVANLLFVWTGWRVRACAWVVAVAAPLLLIALMLWQGAGGSSYGDFPGGFPRVGLSFFLGVLLYRLWRSGWGWRPRVPAAALLVVLPSLYAVLPGAERSYHAALIFAVQPALIWLGAASVPPRTARAGDDVAGAISYAVYAFGCPIQQAIEMAAHRITGTGWNDDIPWFVLWITVPAVLVAGHIVTFHIDAPVRRWLTRRSGAWLRAGRGSSPGA